MASLYGNGVTVMDETPDVLGDVVKAARIRAGMKRSDLATKLDISIRYLMHIENGQRKPRYDLLFKMVRILLVQTDEIFYPEVEHGSKAIKQIISLLHKCDDSDLSVVSATINALVAKHSQ